MDLLPPVTLPLAKQVEALRDRAGVLVLTDKVVVAVRGHDRARWLNGVVTNDVREIAPGGGVYACAVTTKGRILCDLHVHARADELLLVLPTGQADALVAHLERYIVMEDVTLARLEATVVSVQGPDGHDLARDELGESFTADRLGRGGADVVVTPGTDRELYSHAEELLVERSLTVVSTEAWEVARLESGLPAFGVDFGTENFVQEATVTPRAVSFSKGCYLGQEVVCRLEMRGQVHKHLVALTLAGEAPGVGSVVLVGDTPVGSITSATRSVSLPGHSVALAMLKSSAADEGTAVTVGGIPATVCTRPVP